MSDVIKYLEKTYPNKVDYEKMINAMSAIGNVVVGRQSW